jgi:hypothetical protein
MAFTHPTWHDPFSAASGGPLPDGASEEGRDRERERRVEEGSIDKRSPAK